MPTTAPEHKQSNRSRTSSHSYWQRLKEIDMFFQKKDPVYKTMRQLTKRLEKAKIPYAVVGGMAVNVHRYHRTTADVDILVTQESLQNFKKLFGTKEYRLLPKQTKRFVDRSTKVTVDFLIAGFYPGSGKPGPISYPDPAEVSEVIEKVRVIDLATLIQLKLAARRHRDFGDVVELIRFNELDESFGRKLHPSVRRDYIECLEEKRREDEYRVRNA